MSVGTRNTNVETLRERAERLDSYGMTLGSHAKRQNMSAEPQNMSAEPRNTSATPQNTSAQRLGERSKRRILRSEPLLLLVGCQGSPTTNCRKDSTSRLLPITRGVLSCSALGWMSRMRDCPFVAAPPACSKMYATGLAS